MYHNCVTNMLMMSLRGYWNCGTATQQSTTVTTTAIPFPDMVAIHDTLVLMKSLNTAEPFFFNDDNWCHASLIAWQTCFAAMNLLRCWQRRNEVALSLIPARIMR